MKRYNPIEIEPKWQQIWDEQQTYKTDLNSDKLKYIAMSMFNYPSGAGIHIGHAMNYTISDVMARFKRQQGYESYHPVGWDAFGLPAENYAIKTGVSPQESMATIIPSYHKQYKAMGWSNDWSKEISTHEPIYYKWTQWLFTQMYQNGLAYQDARMQWWCEKCQTVLANEQVIDGKCWRHDSPEDPEVAKREVKQWFFKITDYAEELLEATDALDWTESVKTAQKNWIGKSQGAEIEFKLTDSSHSITVFTTRPDTLFGATFMVLAPEHELVEKITTAEHKENVSTYVQKAIKKTEVERQANKEKTGVFTGSYAINPVNDEKIPVWVADYVLSGYGTGAIMAVPAHDERDFEFAKQFSIPIVEVVARRFTHKEGLGVPVEGVETVNRQIVDAIIRNDQDQYLLIVEGDEVHFVGGGVEDGEDNEQAVRREVAEESGYNDLESVNLVGSTAASHFYRRTKNLNQKTIGKFYEVVLASDRQTPSEVDQGLHQMIWVNKQDVAEKLTWVTHEAAWEQYETGNICHDGEGTMINSGKFNGMRSEEAREEIVAWLEQQGLGQTKTMFKLRDWSVSRQRYWGAPIPIINCEICGPVLVPDDQLPVVLPELDDYAPSGDGRSALARATKWLEVDCPKCGEKAERETDTLDTYICSSWYMLRYFDPANEQAIFDSKTVNKWMPVDFYNGGDHATAHMIYARFVTRFLHKLGLIENPEPFKKFLFNGKITGSDGQMFSKSKGNGVDPLEVINSGYGADALRTYMMFAAPLELWVRWDPQGVPGTFRFLNRVWNLVQEFINTKPDSGEKSTAPLGIIHPAILKVTHDIENQKYNTAIAALMEACNSLYELKAKDGFSDTASWRSTLESLVMLMAPFAPHISEELWQELGHKDSVHVDNWPQWDEKYLESEEITVVVQINGKLRAKLEILKTMDEDRIKELALQDNNVKRHLGDKKPAKVIYVPGRLINIVI